MGLFSPIFSRSIVLIESFPRDASNLTLLYLRCIDFLKQIIFLSYLYKSSDEFYSERIRNEGLSSLQFFMLFEKTGGIVALIIKIMRGLVLF